jgi:hypothetical protein
MTFSSLPECWRFNRLLQAAQVPMFPAQGIMARRVQIAPTNNSRNNYRFSQ